ncbi:polyphosphate kinase [Gemmobacter aquarius]|uniref:Polyphosphate kinase n=1 Tax=Paragemmobacter aquarius TaxID=2169400 RepID=A0A2S0UJF4_9RHOB|nr:VOC family protein [Gemmobacter aquarius]AWB47953.1 polyphosphate kinase [Gemmobacter aquarius]
MLTFDHIAISATTLGEGVESVQSALGLPLAGGGQHALMATHNRLLGLGDIYLEVIAPDPSLPAPSHPRWFDLDAFTGPPRLTNWVAACDDLAAEIAASPAGIGTPTALERADFRWDMAIPANGKLPYDGAFPALIHWQGGLHPTHRLPESNARLIRLEITHPDAATLTDMLSPRLSDPRILFTTGPVTAMQATFTTPHGTRSFP